MLISYRYFKKFYFDVLIVLGLLTYGANYFLGIRTNRLVAAKVYSHINPLLSTLFTTLGTTTENELGVDLNHSYQYEYYWNGNDHCYYICISMYLKRRQDLFTMLFRNFWWAEKDRVWIEIPMKARMPLELLLIQNRETQAAFESMEHLRLFVSPDKVKELKDTSLTLFVEHSEITKELFGSWFWDVVRQFENNIVTIHITDQLCYNNYDLCLKAQIGVATYQDYPDIVLKILEMLMKLTKKITKDFQIPQKATKVLKEHRKPPQ